MSDKRYKLEDLKIGMPVKVSELSNIYNMHIILIGAEWCEDGDVKGKIAYIGEELTEESDNIIISNKVRGVYNEHLDIEGEVFYDE